MKLLLNTKLSEEQIGKIEKLGYEVIYMSDDDYRFTEDLKDIDVWFAYDGFAKIDIKDFENLKFIQLPCTGFNHVPKQYIVDHNIYLSNNPNGFASPMSETIVLFILAAYKNIFKMYEDRKKKIWEPDFTWKELNRKTVGFLGTGNISKETARKLKAFGVSILGVNTNGRDIEGFDKCYSMDDSDEFFKSCDVVIGLLPKTEKTTGLVNKEKLDLMKDGSILMNIGRGNLINEDDLKKCIDKFRLVALDVVNNEPLSADDSLWDYDNVMITPHNSWVGEYNRDRLFEEAYRNLKSFIETGKPERYIKDITKGY